ncbi:phage virion morphogenesis protein [Halomarina oriensis]|uniref:HK97 gp10 family phage protein n=1 Tax=Halomarina oriensis TaxID=671145 RepID=A0A6B0GNT8_9EURY|nr:phage virion morphogenesis protein [Halomarina oriensis]MWG36472.1 hypothetical protein [Halomarina oriensis]
MQEFNLIPRVQASLAAAEDDIAMDIADAIHQQVDDNWQSGQDAQGAPWAPNAPSTIRAKGGSTPLVDSEETREDMGTASVGGGVARYGPTTERAGKLLAIHEHGVPEKNIPARPVIGPAADYGEDVAGRVAARSLARALKQL